MTRRKTIIAFFISLSATTYCQNIFDDAVNAILVNNTEYKATKLNTSAEKAAIATSNNLNDPEVEFTHQWGQKGIGNKWGVDVSQSFDWPGVYPARAAANAATASALDYLVDAKMNELRYNVRVALIDYIYAEKKLGAIRRMLCLIDSVSDIYKRGVESGDVSLLDVNKLKIERINLNRRLNETLQSRIAAEGALKNINGGRDIKGVIDGVNGYPAYELKSISTYEQDAINNNPSIKYACAMERAEELNGTAVSRSRFPGLTIGYNHEYEMGDHFNGFKIGLTLPFFSNKRKRSEINARREALMATKTDVETSMVTEIHTVYSQIQCLDSEIAKYADVLDGGEDVRLLNIALAARHITMIDYLSEMNYFLDARLSYIDVAYQRALLMEKLTRYSR